MEELGVELVQTFLQTINGEFWLPLEEGVIPRRSIFISPLVSMGIGCERLEAGNDNGFVSEYIFVNNPF
jgi:hypothetical protein